MKNKVAKVIFIVILLGAIIVPTFGTGSKTISGGTFTTQGVDNPLQS
ncbi:hypothetical protein [Clostridium fungisolvens]|uniref:Uncharacterized protein n=1 Tax=Clostridium fungisolvens TaxID=1604897 RepID=A0A6V8SRT4_9CLOT|nr:hypothetical protein [Clostridium fungisolvens]GFP77603.1 hypothetical protein bsdtw1_03761 [Clostridium fungisolvens]